MRLLFVRLRVNRLIQIKFTCICFICFDTHIFARVKCLTSRWTLASSEEHHVTIPHNNTSTYYDVRPLRPLKNKETHFGQILEYFVYISQRFNQQQHQKTLWSMVIAVPFFLAFIWIARVHYRIAHQLKR